VFRQQPDAVGVPQRASRGRQPGRVKQDFDGSGGAVARHARKATGRHQGICSWFPVVAAFLLRHRDRKGCERRRRASDRSPMLEPEPGKARRARRWANGQMGWLICGSTSHQAGPCRRTVGRPSPVGSRIRHGRPRPRTGSGGPRTTRRRLSSSRSHPHSNRRPGRRRNPSGSTKLPSQGRKPLPRPPRAYPRFHNQRARPPVPR
jgi:hypothetical protein